MVLMTLGLISAIVALTIEEFASAALNAQDKAALELLFYGAAGLCVAGALVFSVRLFLAKRRHSGRSLCGRHYWNDTSAWASFGAMLVPI